MKLFPRLFLNSLIAILLAEVILIVMVILLPVRDLQSDIAELAFLHPDTKIRLFYEIQRDSRRAIFEGFIFSFPLATAVAAGFAFWESRRVASGVKRLEQSSRIVAEGRYGGHVSIEGKDELSSLAEHFNTMSDSLQRVAEDRHELISMVAHELGTPLAALQGYGEALADGIMPAETASRAINREVLALRKIASDLLLVARAEAGSIELHLEPLSPVALAQDAEDRFAALFEDQEISFAMTLQPDLPRVIGDYERAGQVLANLLSNALRYTPKGGEVRLELSGEKDAVTFLVKDTGPGVARKHQAHIFERFYRVDDARSRHKGGLGVGLTISKKLVEAMNGKIGLESSPGQGTTFYFSLPSYQETKAS